MRAQNHFFWLFLLGALIMDQASKYWVINHIVCMDGHMNGVTYKTVIDHVFYLVHVHNRGAAWSLFEDQRWLLLGIGLITVLVVFFFRSRLGEQSKRMDALWGLLCGGILGNMVDRLLWGYVIDFLDIYLPFYHWPTFNVADICIVLGVAGYTFLSYWPKKCTG